MTSEMHHLTVIAGAENAYVRSQDRVITLADTAVLDTVALPAPGVVRTAPNVAFPHQYVGCEVVVHFGKSGDLASGRLTHVDDDWLHIGTDDETKHVRRSKITSMQIERRDVQRSSDSYASYECTGITASVNMIYDHSLSNNRLLRTLCLQNRTSLTGTTTVRFVEHPRAQRPVALYMEERAMPAAMAAAPHPVPSPEIMARAEHAEEYDSPNLRYGLNCVSLPPIDIKFDERWIVCANRAPILRLAAPLIDGKTGKRLFTFSGRLTRAGQPDRVAHFDAWRSRTHLVADFDNDGTLTAFYSRTDERTQPGRLTYTGRVLVWNRADAPVAARVHLQLSPNESFTRNDAPPGEEFIQPVVDRPRDIGGDTFVLNAIDSQAELDESAANLTLSEKHTIAVTALVDPISGADTSIGVIDIQVPANSAAVILYRVIARLAR